MRLRYWVKNALNITAITIAGALLYGVFMWFSVMHDDNDPMFMAMLFLVAFGGFMQAIYGISAYTGFLPVALSLGSTRKEALAGIRVFRLLIMLIIAAAVAVLALLNKGFDPTVLIMTALSLLLSMIFGAWGAFMGMASARYGSKASGAVFVGGLVLLASISVSIIYLAVFLENGESVFNRIISSPMFVWGLVLAIIGLYGISMLPEKKAVYTYEVKM